MNKIYRIVWSASASAFVVASEFAKGDSRGGAQACPPVRRHRLAWCVAALFGCAHPAWAQSLHWDGTDTSGNADGGTGTWDNTTANWDSAATGGANTVWNSTLPNDAVFAGAGTVTIATGGVTAHTLTFNGTGYSFNGATLTLSGASPTLDTASATAGATFNTVIAGTGGLTKTNVGVLRVDGPAASTFATVDVQAGTLAIGPAGRIAGASSTMVAQGATLAVDGTYIGTDGDDTFDAAGTVRGTFAFGAGNDRVQLTSPQSTGGPMPAVHLDGGAGGDDTLAFRGFALDDTALGGLHDWERVSLEGGSTLSLSTAMTGVDTLALDATSALFAHDGASIAGRLSNDGAVHVDASRLGIGGDYIAGPNAILHVLVSPGSNTAGGLDIAGDVTGTTPVVFSSDGSTGGSRASILVIDSPNDVRGDGGFTVSDSPGGTLRLEGSPFAWTFGQADDNRWYLDAEDEVVPEVGGYATLPAVGLETTRLTRQALFGHLDAARGLHGCDAGDDRREARDARRDCDGLWMTASGLESRVGANPGFGYSGDAYGLYVGFDDAVHVDDAREVRVGGFGGFTRGNYWTTGAGATGDANVRLDGPVLGAYGELRDASGAYATVSLMHQRNDAHVETHDGFRQRIDGDSLGLVHQFGWQLAVQDGWSLEPQLQLGVTQMRWRNVVDASGKALVFQDDTTGHARAALRVERAFLSSAGAWRPWFTVGIEDTIGDAHATVSASDVALQGERLGQRWTIDAGVEARLHSSVSLFGALGVSHEINGTSTETRQARVGMRWDW